MKAKKIDPAKIKSENSTKEPPVIEQSEKIKKKRKPQRFKF